MGKNNTFIADKLISLTHIHHAAHAGAPSHPVCMKGKHVFVVSMVVAWHHFQDTTCNTTPELLKWEETAQPVSFLALSPYHKHSECFWALPSGFGIRTTKGCTSLNNNALTIFSQPKTCLLVPAKLWQMMSVQGSAIAAKISGLLRSVEEFPFRLNSFKTTFLYCFVQTKCILLRHRFVSSVHHMFNQ